ncbi:hypothetical protein EYF80_037063 [Liparis tanakae]|uniref:Uncharacterized protein n=1 Tax=Liparis tanakae TaxID=230148 RepID=A0A4Z2GHA3_9TELE|nr:hypothetical protein EYF80_037063 [Liparis tanakae]
MLRYLIKTLLQMNLFTDSARHPSNGTDPFYNGSLPSFNGSLLDWGNFTGFNAGCCHHDAPEHRSTGAPERALRRNFCPGLSVSGGAPCHGAAQLPSNCISSPRSLGGIDAFGERKSRRGAFGEPNIFIHSMSREPPVEPPAVSPSASPQPDSAVAASPPLAWPRPRSATQ